MKKYLEDLLLYAGFILILIGTWKLSPNLAWFVGGGECLIAALLIAWSRKPNDPQ